MRKPADLRAALVAAFPALGTAPERLDVRVERGQLATRLTDTAGFEYRYDLFVLVKDWDAHPSLIFACIVQWLRVQQPDLLQAHDGMIPFEADILDDTSCDLAVTLPLTEAVRFAADPDGPGFVLQHLAEPSVPLDDALDLEGWDGGRADG